MRVKITKGGKGPTEPTVVKFKVKSIGGIAIENIEDIIAQNCTFTNPDMPGIVKKTYQEKNNNSRSKGE